MKKRWWLQAGWIFLWILTVIPGWSQSPTIANDSLSREIKHLHEAGVPGLVWGWQQGDQVPTFQTSGVANLQTADLIQRHHQVRAGNVLKMALGTLVLILADEEKLSLDDAVSEYVEGVPAGDLITLRMLGNQSSGLHDGLSDAEFRRHLEQPLVLSWRDSEQSLKRILSLGLRHKPGKKFSDSPGNAMLLAKVVEKVTATPWYIMLQNRVLRPLGAGKAKVPSGDQAGVENSPKRMDLKGYQLGSAESIFTEGDVQHEVTRLHPAWTGAGGDWLISADELMALARPLAKGALLSERMRAEQRTWIKTGHRHIRYGFCLQQWQGNILGHSGVVPGFSTMVGWNEKTDASVVVWCNLSQLTGTTQGSKLQNPSHAERLGLKILRQK